MVFENGAYRYDVAGVFYLRFHSSLLVGDGEGTERLVVIKKGEKHGLIDKPCTG